MAQQSVLSGPAIVPTFDSTAVPDQCSEIRFGQFRLLVRERRLERDGLVVALGGRALDILAALVSRPGEVVSKAELSEAAWPGMLVEDGSLRFHIASLRRALGGRGQADAFLTTVAGRGYCFTGEISRMSCSPGKGQRQPGAKPRLPSSAKSVFGIARETSAAAEELLARRFLTVVGPPGIGKTTLAVELAHKLVGGFPDGVAFVDLGSVTAPQLVPNAVAAAIGRLLPSERQVDNLLGVLDRRQMLLIFDGCEHLIDAVAELAERLYQGLPNLSILATSRESLRVEGEHVYRLVSLGSPLEGALLTAHAALAFPAVELFVARIQANRVGYELTEEDAPIVAEICRKLDGIPLALELAAGRVASYGIRQTAMLLDGRLRLLWKGWRTAPRRHQTLSAALDWSYDLLSPTERQTLRRIAVFVGCFTMSGACMVAADPSIGEDRISQTLASLVEKSLVLLEEVDGEARYRLLDTTRVYQTSAAARSHAG